ncbi:phospholipase D-like domain-containing protein [Nostoc sp. ChiSLP03a]|uniref:phospholipase D-like domain-containing protein n=1 Tax=Nostoc sp. ChiSLP03a TaxID=3075380 RepID=UPI00391AFC70
MDFLIENTSKIHDYRNLHAKVVFGDHLCLLGSANLTKMGITQKAEMSILLDERNYIEEIKNWFENSWSSSGEVNKKELEDYIQRIIKTTPTLESQNSCLNSDAPIIRSKMIAHPKKSEKEVSQSKSKKDKEPWNGRDYYVNCSKSEHRNWDDWQRYSFVSAGTGTFYRGSIKNLFLGLRVFVYIPDIGYVGVGLVTDPAVRVKDFTVLVNGQQVPILDVPLVSPKMDEYADDLDKSEYLVRVEWIKTVPKSQAYWEEGLFYNQHPACKMSDSSTIKKLSQHFGLND